jgi:thiol peroxidase
MDFLEAGVGSKMRFNPDMQSHLHGAHSHAIVPKRKNEVTFNGKYVTLVGHRLKEGDQAPDFNLVKTDSRSVISLTSFPHKTIILSVVPSLDSYTGSEQAKRLNQELPNFKDTVILQVSMDLPVAQKRWAEENQVENLCLLSDHQGSHFGSNYGILIDHMRILSRAVIVITPHGVIKYIDPVTEIFEEPHYDAVFEVVKHINKMEKMVHPKQHKHKCPIRKGQVEFHGCALSLLGDDLQVGVEAPDFTLTLPDFTDFHMKDLDGLNLLLSVTPSLEFSSCVAQVQRFMREEKELRYTKILHVSLDLPFALAEYLTKMNNKTSYMLSDHKRAKFAKDYGLLINEMRLAARAVILISKERKIEYVEIVSDLMAEPDYEAALAAVKALP